MGDRAGRPIREELLSIPGIAGAEFEGDPSTPAGVRVQLAPGADAEVVGREVRRVLAGHGMRSQMTAPAVAPRRPPPPPEPRTVVNLADFDQGASGRAKADEAAGQPDVEPVVVPDPEPDALAGVGERVPAEGPPDVSETEAEADSTAVAASSVPILGEVVVRQRGKAVFVSVAAGERVVERPAVATSEGIERALLDAICELLGVAPVPRLVSVDEIEKEGSRIVGVLIEDGSSRGAGSAVVGGSRAWAVAKALWSAVSGPA